MCSHEKGNKTEFLSQLVRGETKRKELNIRADLTANKLGFELCSESNYKLAKSNYVIDLHLQPVEMRREKKEKGEKRE